MKVIYIYNMESEIERNNLNRIRAELGENLILEYDYQEVRDIIPVRATPAFVFIREDLQGDELFDGDAELKITAEVYKAITDEDEKIHKLNSRRFDIMIDGEKTKVLNAFKAELKAELTSDDLSAVPQAIKEKLGL